MRRRDIEPEDHPCIRIHKPDKNVPLGTIWACPDCGKKHERVDFDMQFHDGTMRVAWQSPPDGC